MIQGISTPRLSSTRIAPNRQPLQRLFQRLAALGEAKTDAVLDPTFAIKGRNGDRSDRRLYGEAAAERNVVTIRVEEGVESATAK